jgi:hypothetical protein
VFDPSVEQIIATGVSVAFTTAVGTACRIWYGRFMHRWKLAEMDKECQNQLKLEGVREKRPQRQLDRPRPPPSR